MFSSSVLRSGGLRISEVDVQSLERPDLHLVFSKLAYLSPVYDNGDSAVSLSPRFRSGLI